MSDTQTKQRNIRIDDDLWRQVVAQARADGVTASDWMRAMAADALADDAPLQRRAVPIHAVLEPEPGPEVILVPRPVPAQAAPPTFAVTPPVARTLSRPDQGDLCPACNWVLTARICMNKHCERHGKR